MTRPPWLPALAAHLATGGFLTWQATGTYPTSTSWPAFLEHLPPEPDRVVALTGYGGEQAPIDREPRVQILVRGDGDPRTSRDVADALHDYLHDQAGGVELPGGLWLACAPGLNGGAIALGVDGNRRYRHVTNHALTIGA